MNPVLLPPPSDVASAAGDLLAEGTLLNDVRESLSRVVTGFLLAAAFGVTLGIVLSLSSLLSSVLRPVLETVRPIPAIAWIPLAILWFGVGNLSSYFIVAIAGFFPVFVNTYTGMQGINERYLELASLLGASRRRVLFEVMIPAALPMILTGIRVGLGVAWMAVIAAELIATRSGLGYMIQLNRSLLRTPEVIVGMILIGVVGYIMGMALEVLQHRLTPWHTRALP